ncbi:MAG: protein-L-isoaspartate(D-aspartate) O-methyltransferase [Phycisphaerales bacterium]|nr:protein-L-isoaspartate(D-aspartate) O-methyltransferase [Phycisphaerales bacterium]
MNDVGTESELHQMIQQQIIGRGITDQRVIEAFYSVPRELFFLDTFRKNAFGDHAAPIGHGQTISQPYMVALMTQRLGVEPHHRVLEIGTGSGYQTAILARLAGEVYTLERIKPLLDDAWERLQELKIRNVHYRFGDGTLGWPEAAPFDRILITAGAPALPHQLLLEQLTDGGSAVLPVGPENQQTLIGVIRQGNELYSADICGVRFVKLIGRHGWADE